MRSSGSRTDGRESGHNPYRHDSGLGLRRGGGPGGHMHWPTGPGYRRVRSVDPAGTCRGATDVPSSVGLVRSQVTSKPRAPFVAPLAQLRNPKPILVVRVDLFEVRIRTHEEGVGADCDDEVRRDVRQEPPLRVIGVPANHRRHPRARMLPLADPLLLPLRLQMPLARLPPAVAQPMEVAQWPDRCREAGDPRGLCPLTSPPCLDPTRDLLRGVRRRSASRRARPAKAPTALGRSERPGKLAPPRWWPRRRGIPLGPA